MNNISLHNSTTSSLSTHPLMGTYDVLRTFVVVVVQSVSHVWLFMTPWAAGCQASLTSPSPRTCSKSCPLSQWCHPTIFSSSIPFSSCLESFPASGSFPISWLFAPSGQSIRASASGLSMTIQGWLPLGLIGLISLQSKEISRVFSNTTVQSINSLALSLLYGPILTSIHDYWKTHCFDYTDRGPQT